MFFSDAVDFFDGDALSGGRRFFRQTIRETVSVWGGSLRRFFILLAKRRLRAFFWQMPAMPVKRFAFLKRL